jgi:hypothetical protein
MLDRSHTSDTATSHPRARAHSPVPLVALLALAAAALGAGCRCNGGGVGDACSGNDDCDPGLYCDPNASVCMVLGDAGADSGGGGSTDAGSDAAACADADGDGVTTCAGDCNDADPLTYPGAPEVCGDAIDNSCAGGTPDAGCMGLGTYVAPPPLGDNAQPGTQALPVATIAQGMVNAMTIGGSVDVYVAAGTYDEAVTMVDDITLLGGYESATWTRDPAVNISLIADTTTTGVVVPTGVTGVTELSGFTITAMPGGNTALTIAGGADPFIFNNVINGPNTGGRSTCIEINVGGAANTSSPTIQRNALHLGDGGGGWPGGSAGIWSELTPAAIVENDVTLSGADITVWGIVSFSSVPGLVIQFNRVRPAVTGTNNYGAGIEVGADGAYIDSNDIGMGTCYQSCAGIVLEVVSAVVTNNVSFGGVGNPSAGLRVVYENPGTTLRDLLVHSNFLEGGGMSGTQGTSVGVDMVNLSAVNSVVVGRFINNIIESGVADYRYCMQENMGGIDPELLEANDYFIEPGSSPALVSGLYRDEGLTTMTMLSQVNGLPEIGALLNISYDPLLVMPVVGGDYHLMPGSPCIDAGSSTELPALDFEADPRPGGAYPDIGPDET